MFKKFFFTVLFVALIQSVFASGPVFFERSLAEMGYSDFSVDLSNSSSCQDFVFTLPADIEWQNNELFSVFSMKFRFLPVTTGDAKISVSLNGAKIDEIFAKNSNCIENDCVSRINFSKILLENTQNTLKVCPSTSSSISKIVVESASTIGLYKMPFFKKEDFVLSPESSNALVGKDVVVKISIKNSGSAEAMVDLNYIKPIVEEKIDLRAFKVLEGETRWSGKILAGETKEFYYTIKTMGPTLMSLPASIACFENVFNETQCLISNYPQMEIAEPSQKIEAILLSNEVNNVNEKVKLQLAVKNNSSSVISNISAYLNVPNELFSESENNQNINSINPMETKYLTFWISSQGAGTFNVGCQLVYADGAENSRTSCDVAKIVFEGKKIDLPVIAGIIFLLVGIAIYAYIEFGK